MTHTFRPAHLLAMIAALLITSAAFSNALTVPVDQASIATSALA